jgi:hypothetical protein
VKTRLLVCQALRRNLAKPKKDTPPGTIDITVRTRVAPLLLRLSWLGWPLFHSREHGWTFRVPNTAEFTTRLAMREFHDPADDKLLESNRGYTFYKVPHKDGENANVGNPLAKPFMKFAQDGTMTSPGDEAKEALDMNAQCSYWISARDRILNQNVVWQDEKLDVGFKGVGAEKKCMPQRKASRHSGRICLDASSGSEEQKVIYSTSSKRLLSLIDRKLLLWGVELPTLSPRNSFPQDSVPIK